MQERYGEITKQVLLGIGVAGIVVVVAAAPGIVLATKLFEQNKKQFPKKYDKRRAARTIQRLKRKKLVNIKEEDGKFTLKLTKEGQKQFQKMKFENLQISKPPHWDKKWRLVMFDIPEEALRSARGILRAKLKEWEFYPLQKSVWVCPWPCEKEIQMVSKLYGITRYVDIVIAEKIENDKNIRKRFEL
jgi:DNA-binding transcriptional regulator PaaX